MPSYDKLPSGKWRGRAMLNGKSVSVTGETKRECIRKIDERLQIKRGEMTVGAAMKEYIENHRAIFSPSTVVGYEKICRNYFLPLQKMRLSDVNETEATKAINLEAKKHSPKTVRNAWGLIRTSLSPFVPVNEWRITLPSKRKTDIFIPTEEEVSELLLKAAHTDMEIPLKLAALCGLRRSEISALTYGDVSNGYIIINKALVKDENGIWQLKNPKTYSGYRKIKLPSNLILEGEKSERITNYNPDNLTKRCRRLTNNKYSMHDLRHYYASVLLKIGIPNKYAAKRMGHSGEQMLQRVYQHLFEDADNHFDEIIAKKMSEK